MILEIVDDIIVIDNCCYWPLLYCCYCYLLMKHCYCYWWRWWWRYIVVVTCMSYSYVGISWRIWSVEVGWGRRQVLLCLQQIIHVYSVWLTSPLFCIHCIITTFPIDPDLPWPIVSTTCPLCHCACCASDGSIIIDGRVGSVTNPLFVGDLTTWQPLVFPLHYLPDLDMPIPCIYDLPPL